MTRVLPWLLLGSTLFSPVLVAEQKVILSPVYPIIKKYKSMEGPSSMQTVYLGDRDHPELLWLTAIRTEVVGPDGTTKMSPELMCHMNVDIDSARHQTLFHLQRMPATRLMTISQGMGVAGGAFEARLPDGFAFPIASNEPLIVMTQVLNHNIEHPKNLNVRHRVTFEYVRDRDLKKRPIALFNLGISGMVQMADNPMAMAAPMPGGDHGPSCLIGMRAPNAMGMSSDYVDPQGRHLTGHWVVPPGKQVNASDVTWFMALPYDTKLHYAAVHLHPYARSLTLRDTTAGVDVFTAHAQNPKHRVGLKHVDSFVSVPGVPLYKDHKYEIVSVYDNPTKHNADSMASMFLAVDDPEFAVPSPEDLVVRGTTVADAVAVILRTTAGDVAATLIHDPAPPVIMRSVIEFAQLVNAGAFRDIKAEVQDSSITFRTPVTGRMRELLQSEAMAAVGDPAPGSIALCSEEGAMSFAIVLRRSPQLGRCTEIGQLGPGSEVIRALSAAGGQLMRAEIMNAADLNGLQLAPAKTASR